MKKSTIIAGCFVGLLVSLFFFHAAATAARGTGSTCTADDNALFPNGFFCGSDPEAVPNPVNLSPSVGGSPFPGVSDLNAAYRPILTGSVSTVRFTTGYTQNSAPGREVLVWVTIDGDTSIIDNSSITGTSGTEASCPGIGAPVYAPVYNYRDPQPNGTNGPNASPSAYTDADHGFENCGSNGKMVYWRNASNGANNYGFDLNLQAGRTGYFCVRTNVSLRLSASDSYFTGNDGSSYSGGYRNQNSVASHVAHQSDPQCYVVYNGLPTGQLHLQSCSIYAASRAQDPDHPGAGVFFRLRYMPNYPSSTGSRVVGAQQASDASGGGSGTATMLPNRWYQLEVLDPDITGVPGVNPWIGVEARRAGPGVNCATDALPYADRAMDCNTLKIHNIFDPDDRGGGVFWEIILYDGPFPTTPQEETARERAYYNGYNGNHSNVNIDINPSFDRDGINNGWSAKLIIHNYPNDGSPSGSGTASYTTPAASLVPCYTASCTAQVRDPVPGTANGVVAGQDFYVRATLTNLGAAATLDGTNFGVDFNNDGSWQWGRPAGYNHFPSGSNATRGGPAVSFDIGPFRAPSDITSWNINFFADFLGHYPLAPSGGTIPYCAISDGASYKHFTLTPHAQLVDFNEEDPSTLQYHTYVTDNIEHVNDSGPSRIGGIPTSTTRSLFKLNPTSFVTEAEKNYGGIATLFESIPDNNTRILTNAEYASVGAQPDHRRDYGTSAVFNNPPGYVAGDQFCARLTVDPGIGYIGPGDHVTGDKPTTDSHCPHVTNKPYFKVFGGSISAGGQFKNISTNCANPAGEGIIAGYNNTTAAGYNFGGSAQLTALAMNAITGVASGQTKYDKSPTRLSFSNTQNVVSVPSDYSPRLGGNFNTAGGAGSCLTTAGRDLEKPLQPISDGTLTPAMSGQYVYSGAAPLRISGGQIGNNVSIFTDTADVIITQGSASLNGIQYSPGTWNKSNVPSLVVHAKGDIYIDKDVGVLDGMFISEKPGGRISTCSTAAGALVVNDGNYYDNCSKQLTVHGSFVADRINLMRTYGTMRDEKPTSSAGHTKLDIRWVTGADGPNPLGFAYNCVNTLEGYVAGRGWDKAYICLPASSGIHMAWSCQFDSAYTQATAPYPCQESQNSLNARGFTNCTRWQNPAISWQDNMLCWDGGGPDLMKYSLSPIAGQDCSLTITQSQAPDWQQAYICQAPDVPSVPTGLPTTLNCSNNGGTTFNRTVAGASAGKTCAAEVFDFSPEQYLSHPAILPPNKGAMVWDSVTSLPPVL